MWGEKGPDGAAKTELYQWECVVIIKKLITQSSTVQFRDAVKGFEYSVNFASFSKP